LAVVLGCSEDRIIVFKWKTWSAIAVIVMVAPVGPFYKIEIRANCHVWAERGATTARKENTI
jgi:hypothetical protein